MAKVEAKRSKDGYGAADEVMRGGVLLACHHGLRDEQIDYMHETFSAFAGRY